MFLRWKSPCECLFGHQNLDSDWHQCQNRQVKLESMLTSFDQFTLLFAYNSLVLFTFHPLLTNFYHLETDLRRFRWFYDRLRQILTIRGRISRRRRVMEIDGYLGFPAIIDDFWSMGTWKMDWSLFVHHVQGIMDY